MLQTFWDGIIVVCAFLHAGYPHCVMCDRAIVQEKERQAQFDRQPGQVLLCEGALIFGGHYLSCIYLCSATKSVHIVIPVCVVLYCVWRAICVVLITSHGIIDPRTQSLCPLQEIHDSRTHLAPPQRFAFRINRNAERADFQRKTDVCPTPIRARSAVAISSRKSGIGLARPFSAISLPRGAPSL